MKNKIKKYLITTGDANGVGLEVTCKALGSLRPPKEARFIVVKNNRVTKKHFVFLKKYKPVHLRSLHEALSYQFNSKENELLFVHSKDHPAQWVFDSAQACKSGFAQALVTGPLSKTSMSQSGFQEMGHTGILKKVDQSENMYMYFKGQHFNVALLTDHVPLHSVSSALSGEKLLDLIQKISLFNNRINDSRPIAVLGLNPHAGEDGLIGKEELSLKKVLASKSIKKLNSRVVGPLSADSAFSADKWKRYSCYVAMYHDQGLIPFKMAHKQSGVHVTLGLSFLRTSVDHGCAFDIFDKSKASPKSMISAIKLALKLS